ncbi:hypothetical protein I9W82_001499 [Candida metapsilosis]|uniref:Uncharacterized protein n=1 Tax=Candida metapsilosis TaxID=273372 RepID=A0A8H8DDV7_9ASCO|nr:hypothetical protein I9W82_001499 [Candida metapsilosis]
MDSVDSTPLTKDAFNKANNIKVHNTDIKPIQNDEELKPLLHYSLNTIKKRLEKPFNKYYSYSVPGALQKRDLIFTGNYELFEIVRICVLNRALRNRTLSGHQQIIYITINPVATYSDFSRVNYCSVKINSNIMTYHYHPEILIVTPYEFLSMHPNKNTLVVVQDFKKMLEQGFLDDMLAKKTQVIMIDGRELTMTEYKSLCRSRTFGFVDYYARESNTNSSQVKIVLRHYDSEEFRINAIAFDFSPNQKSGIFVNNYKTAESLKSSILDRGAIRSTLNVAKCKRNNIKSALKEAKAQNALILSTKFNILKRMNTVYFFDAPRLKSFQKFVKEFAGPKPKKIVVMLESDDYEKQSAYADFVSEYR